jgi:hypothetical protein
MGNSQRQESFAAMLPVADSPVQPLTGAVEAGPQDDLSGQIREEEWQRRLRSLQEWIAELLIRNQQLRMALWDSTSDHQFMDANE